MADSQHSISAPSDVESSLDNALWFVQNGRFLAALYALENALTRCVDERRARIAALMDCLGNAPVAQLAGGARV